MNTESSDSVPEGSLQEKLRDYLQDHGVQDRGKQI